MIVPFKNADFDVFSVNGTSVLVQAWPYCPVVIHSMFHADSILDELLKLICSTLHVLGSRLKDELLTAF